MCGSKEKLRIHPVAISEFKVIQIDAYAYLNA